MPGDLYAPTPGERLAAAAALTPRAARKLQAKAGAWPEHSPGAVNAWLLLVTTKPPSWREPLLEWRELPLSVGHPHEGFFYPDPLGFWPEVRRWAVELVRPFAEPGWGPTEAVSCTTLLHLGDEPRRLRTAREVCRPRVLLFLDEPGWHLGGLELEESVTHALPDPHRDGQVYQGIWGRLPDGTVAGKAPQHPTMHRLYRPGDMTRFLASAPRPAGN